MMLLWLNSGLHYVIGSFTLVSADEERIGITAAQEQPGLCAMFPT